MGRASPSAADPALRFGLFASVGSLLGDCAAAGPLLVILDDAHRADQGSLAVLRILAADLASMPAVVVVAYRDGDAGAGPALDAIRGLIEASSVPVI